MDKRLTLDLPSMGRSRAGGHRTKIMLGSIFDQSSFGARDCAISTALPLSRPQRTRLWELPSAYHCSIIGTCLSTADLRKLVSKLGFPEAKALTDHDLHKYGVTLAGKRDGSGKFLQKALDRKHQTFIVRFEHADSEAALGRLWDEAALNGDIPGAYWATLTHPHAGDALRRRIFGEVHMLSHLVGAANRADIRRLILLEQEIGELKTKAERQQAAVREAITTRDAKIRALGDLLAKANANSSAAEPAEAAITARLREQLGTESERRQKCMDRLAAVKQQLEEERKLRQAAEQREQALRYELELVEASLCQSGPADEATSAAKSALHGKAVLYVGGHPGHVSALRDLAQEYAADLLYHDGGIEDHVSQLPGLISQAAHVFFPVDCISHDAMLNVKRHCRNAGKRYVPLRTSGLTTFLAALRAADTCPLEDGAIRERAASA